jgi:hypothetical protein
MKGLGFFPSLRALFISNLSWASKVIGPNKSTGFYILPRAENKAAIVYKGQGKDTCKAIRIKGQYGRIAQEGMKEHKRTSSWTRGLLSPEGLEEHLSTIVPKISQEKS